MRAQLSQAANADHELCLRYATNSPLFLLGACRYLPHAAQACDDFWKRCNAEQPNGVGSAPMSGPRPSGRMLTKANLP